MRRLVGSSGAGPRDWACAGLSAPLLVDYGRKEGRAGLQRSLIQQVALRAGHARQARGGAGLRTQAAALGPWRLEQAGSAIPRACSPSS